ncbi:MAG: hypothetical protein JKX81_18860 [Arenicella sp.]|nr:hypothetical protein [Arenicella sp.]
MGKVLWEKIKQQHDCLFWRCRPDNPINDFYFKRSSGCYKTPEWNIFWCGLSDFNQIEECIQYALQKKLTLTEETIS